MKQRKQDHIRLCLEGVGEDPWGTGLEDFRLVHDALPELSLDQIDPSTDFLGHRLALPFMIAPMSAGHDGAEELNRSLAEAAQKKQVALALGSLRPALDGDRVLHGLKLRSIAPSIPLLGNIGLWQLRDSGLAMAVQDLALELDLDALTVHVNVAQELIQPEGERDFTGGMDSLFAFAADCPIPLFVKEIGFGLSNRTLNRLTSVPLAGVDVAGAGGTNFALIEAARTDDPAARALADQLQGWGVPTASALCAARNLLPDRTIIASGGLRTALDFVKCLALGADLVSAAAPVLAAAHKGQSSLEAWFDQLHHAMIRLMLLTASPDLASLRDGLRIVENAGV